MKSKDKSTKQTRIPRPLGTTEMARSLHQLQETKENNYNNDIDIINTYRDLYIHIIQSYINTNFKYCNKPINIQAFAYYINIPSSLIETEIFNQSKIQYNLLNENSKEEIYGVIMQQLFSGALSDRSTALQHANVLLQQQGNQYVPFLSSEVTKALSLTQNSSNVMLQIASRLFGPNASGITINNNNAQQNNASYFGPTEALALIHKELGNRPLIEDTNAMNNLYLEYHLDEMPEVNANAQQGIDHSKEGLNFNKMTELRVENLVSKNEIKKGHIDRRAHEIEIDLDNDQI